MHEPLPSPTPELPAAGLRIDARQQDAYWREAFRRERYARPGLDYEDYAPAYCVGYVGYAQYGGSFEDAEVSLCANWERLRAGSRLPFDEARAAIRAAWDRVARLADEAMAWPAIPTVPPGQHRAAREDGAPLPEDRRGALRW